MSNHSPSGFSSPTKRLGWESLNICWNEEALPSIDQEVRILCLTWNMKGMKIPNQISDVLLSSTRHHLLLISTQECLRPIAYSVFYSKMQDWERKVMQELGPEFNLIAGESLGGTHQMLVSHETLTPLIKNIQISTITTGFFNVIPNKGAVAFSFELGKHRILSIGCHLASGAGNLSERNEGIRRILGQIPDSFDWVVVYGDMNYRIQGDVKQVKSLIEEKERSVLLKMDELIEQMRIGNIPVEMKEGEIRFQPTYKLNQGIYDDNRAPSWTDRIMYKTNGNLIRQMSYSSIPNIYSDHFPVFSQFTINL